MVCGILLLVPNAIAAAGGLGTSSSDQSDSTNSNNEQEINTAIIVSIRMILVSQLLTSRLKFWMRTNAIP